MATYKKVCEVDGTPFTATRRDARTCSDPCKKKLQRGVTPPKESEGIDPQPDNLVVPLADNLKFPGTRGGKSSMTRKELEEADSLPTLGQVATEGFNATIAKKRAKKIVAEPKAPEIEVPVSMKDRMTAITERMNERYRAKGMPLISTEPEVFHFVQTGIEELDAITAAADVSGVGGLPRKRITEIYGPKGAGKSSLVKQIMKHNPELKVLFFDAEGGMIGAPENMQVVKGNVVEDIMTMLVEAVESQEFDLIILDSIASLITRKQYEDDPEGKAAMARSFGPHVKRLVAYLQPLKEGLPDPAPGTAVVFINQFRSTTQAFGVQEYTVGGKSMEYYASLRLCFRSAKTDYIIRGGNLAGQQVRVKVDKTRFGPKDQEFKFPLMFDELRDFNEHYIKRLKEMGLR